MQRKVHLRGAGSETKQVTDCYFTTASSASWGRARGCFNTLNECSKLNYTRVAGTSTRNNGTGFP